jgi:hypothetical protein
MNLQIRRGIYLPAKQLLSSQEEICSTELLILPLMGDSVFLIYSDCGEVSFGTMKLQTYYLIPSV